MKGGREHRVPLSPPTLEILRELPRDGEFVFARTGGALGINALTELLARMGRRGKTVHGFRSSFRDWCAETTAYPSEVIEMSLAHTITNKAEAAYRRGDLLEKRRKLMTDWSAYCASPGRAADVVPIRSAEHA